VAGERLGVIAALAHFAIGMTAGAAFAFVSSNGAGQCRQACWRASATD
jgi:hypothetical protein